MYANPDYLSPLAEAIGSQANETTIAAIDDAASGNVHNHQYNEEVPSAATRRQTTVAAPSIDVGTHHRCSHIFERLIASRVVAGNLQADGPPKLAPLTRRLACPQATACQLSTPCLDA